MTTRRQVLGKYILRISDIIPKSPIHGLWDENNHEYNKPIPNSDKPFSSYIQHFYTDAILVRRV